MICAHNRVLVKNMTDKVFFVEVPIAGKISTYVEDFE